MYVVMTEDAELVAAVEYDASIFEALEVVDRRHNCSFKKIEIDDNGNARAEDSDGIILIFESVEVLTV